MALVNFDSVDMSDDKKTVESGDIGVAEESEESIRERLLRSQDQIGLILMVLHYRNRASDEEKIRQIRVIVE